MRLLKSCLLDEPLPRLSAIADAWDIALEVASTQEMAEALARLWTDPALRAELRQRGLAQAQRFNWQTTAHQTLMCYRALAQADH